MFTSVRSVKGCFSHIRALLHIRSSMSTEPAKIVACAIVSSRLDYCNSVLAGMSEANYNKLERVQYTRARVVTGMLALLAYSRDHQFSQAELAAYSGSGIFQDCHDGVQDSPYKAAILPSRTDRGCCFIHDLAVVYMSAMHATRIKNYVGH